VAGCGSFMACALARGRGEAWLKKGCPARSSVARPRGTATPGEEVTGLDKVITGVGPHKLSVTIEARDSREILRATGRFGTAARGYRPLLATGRPRDLPGQTRRQMAAEELDDIQRRDPTLQAMKAEPQAAVIASGSHLMDIHGTGPAGAARIPRRRRGRGPVPPPGPLRLLDRHRTNRRFLRAAHPPPAVAGGKPPDQPRALHRWHHPVAQQHPPPRLLPPPRRRRKTPMEAIRRQRRRLPDAVYRQLAAGARAQQAGPAGHSGATLLPARPAFPRSPALRTSHVPDPYPRPCPRPSAEPHLPAARTGALPRPHAPGINVDRPIGPTTLTPTSAGAPPDPPGRPLDKHPS
jgi:transposase